ncbi:twin-arginine translocase TatA/TatE family subunit [Microbacterium sp. cx-55]|uniref:twin-arginine translocase TatA/TatE family subunit n=1 Tax=Microbacterium sp. cx-55 TaxID=2875948 RepID=UPI001CC1811B|nr:twin-arginine translocase TatA/TatE family subunit [Microbacterium sp. cx-55]MBZ4487582.1 twin-arginine translocase TatA/TatE family subunit [Microbacterium sp. cx-55]UGB35601.1 twin-arginine translocase TatA/TatE family subunit [Microbacterium sp. cx-55]
MFGLTTEKLILVALVAVIVLGPARLPGYARRLADTVRLLRSALETARHRAETETGVRWDPERMRALDPRRFDPRSVLRDALTADPVPAAASGGATPTADLAERAPTSSSVAAETETETDPSAVAYRIRTVGTSAHPRRVRVPADAPDAGQPRPLSLPAAPVPMRTPNVPG